MTSSVDTLEDVELLLRALVVFEKIFYALPQTAQTEKSQILQASAYLLDFTMIEPSALPSFRVSCEKVSQVQALIQHKQYIKVVASKAPNVKKRPTFGANLLDSVVEKTSKLLNKSYNNRSKTIAALDAILCELEAGLLD